MSDAGRPDPAAKGEIPRRFAYPAPRREDADRHAAEADAKLSGYEFATFRCGSMLIPSLRDACTLDQEDFRREAQRELRFALERIWPAKRFEKERPDVLVDADPATGTTRVVAMPLLVAGRYRKLARGISQTIFHCRACRGYRRRGRDGCKECGGTGLVVAESVESFVRPAVQSQARGKGTTFHGSGREDVDVRMLGAGRPFVVSVEMPRRRTIDFGEVARAVAASSGGRVEVADLRVVTRDEARAITDEHGDKTYRVVATCPGGGRFPEDAAARARGLAGVVLAQRTPRRVDDRRADMIRARRILAIEVEAAEPDRLVLRLRTEPGTYVKEFVSGDGGRTEPSLAGALGVPCDCSELDVLAVGGAEPARDVRAT